MTYEEEAIKRNIKISETKLHSHSERVHSIRERHGTITIPRAFYDLVSMTIEQVQGSLKRIKDETDGRVGVFDVPDEMKAYYYRSLLAKLAALDLKMSGINSLRGPEEDESGIGNLVQRLDESKLEGFPLAISYVVARKCEDYGVASPIVLHPTWEYNYSFQNGGAVAKRIMFGNPEADSSGDFSLMREPHVPDILIFSLPIIERENILLHCMLGHEIGHFVLERERPHEKAIQSVLDSLISGRLKLGDLYGENQPHVEAFEDIKVAHRAAQRWTTEVACDIFGCHAFGPAFTYAFFDTIMPALDSRDPTWHPPNLQRLAIQLRTLKEAGYPEVVKHQSHSRFKLLGQYGDMMEQLARSTTLGSSILDRKAPFEAELLSLAGSVHTTSRAGAYSDHMFEKSVGPLLELLEEGVPPCETLDQEHQLQSTGPISILNAGWAYQISSWWAHATGAKLGKAPLGDKVVNNLVLKAIEGNEACKLLRRKKVGEGDSSGSS